MKKRIAVIVILLAAFASGFIPVTKSDSFRINAPFDNVYRQFTSPGSWAKWQRNLKRINQTEIKIDSGRTGFNITTPVVVFNVIEMGLGNFAITEIRPDGVYNFNCALIPDNKTNKSVVTASTRTSLFRYLAGIVTKKDETPPLAGLKSYVEDTRQYYGFTIRKELTQKKLIAVERNAFLTRELYRQTDDMLSRLNHFIAKNRLEITSPLQMQYVSVAKDSTQLMLGFPVDKKPATINGGEYMTMPPGRILVGYFNDRYKNRGKLYNAMRQYMRDNYIHPIIQPFERFDNNKLPASDSSVVNMQLIVPYM
ncbi:hypothetical protein [Mucilaginibacter sp. L3T2-6]|uniref:hypothetical protein n=1 Tax=Mucilaginibacter sp. L3T2-6 TaxID=3062491 RepID=UPI002675002B|nr:hypothetical protein [Mucilaginibacter sp. L3T2-6]MDO3645056.1 hypothetical protein [Mucilaginibacter sp. L3T2-6]MDV6217507.1 hypothetical protein [Mucilaginibacter sp. L3T2-6]